MSPAPPDAVLVLGAGRAGLSLGVALQAAGVRVVAVHGRRALHDAPGAVARLPHTHGPLPEDALTAASVVLVAVRDAQLDDALRELDRPALRAGTVVLHASGARTPEAAAPLRARGAAVGTFHPLLPLAAPAHGAERLRGAWIGLDGDVAAVAAGERLAAALGARTLHIPAGAKGAYHAAAVIASNLPVALAVLASGLLRGQGVPAEAADGAVRSLLATAVANLHDVPLDAEGGARALTGPLARGDVATVALHLAALPPGAPARGPYVALAGATLAMLRDAGAGDTPEAAALRALLREAELADARRLRGDAEAGTA